MCGLCKNAVSLSIIDKRICLDVMMERETEIQGSEGNDYKDV